jgi:AraC-like DNA-binding protein
MAETRRRGAGPVDEPLLRFAGAGHETWPDAGYFHDARRRRDPPHVVLQLTLAGEAFYAGRDGGRIPLPPGTAFIDHIPGPFSYGYATPAAGPPRALELVFVSLYGPAARRWMDQLVARFGHVLPVGRRGPVEEQLLAIAHARDSGALGDDPYQLSGRLYQLVMSVYSTLTARRVATSPRVSRAIELIAAHAGDAAFGVAELAARLDCSREHLARQFADAVGTSPADAIARQRIRLAARQLRETDDKLDVVARASGFAGANYLCRVFRQRVGVSPAEFRRRTWMSVS